MRILPLLLLPAVLGCSGTIPRRSPVGEAFPAVRGESLAGEGYEIPRAFAGRPVLLLVGYVQDAQFDIDRWLLGVLQGGVDVPAYEIPTIRGLAPRVVSGWIDDGMRGGIPREEWGTVVTVYGDAGDIARFTGTEGGSNARVLLLDAEGRVAFFHDRGYSAATLLRLRDALAALRERG